MIVDVRMKPRGCLLTKVDAMKSMLWVQYNWLLLNFLFNPVFRSAFAKEGIGTKLGGLFNVVEGFAVVEMMANEGFGCAVASASKFHVTVNEIKWFCRVGAKFSNHSRRRRSANLWRY